MLTKKNVLKISLVYILLTAIIFLVAEMCHSSWCMVREDKFPGSLLLILFPLFPTLLFSLITYKMPDEVFRGWIKFARWAVPVMIVVTYLNNSDQSSNIMSGTFDALLYVLLYGTFILVSLILIITKYLKLRGEKK